GITFKDPLHGKHRSSAELRPSSTPSPPWAPNSFHTKAYATSRIGSQGGKTYLIIISISAQHVETWTHLQQQANYCHELGKCIHLVASQQHCDAMKCFSLRRLWECPGLCGNWMNAKEGRNEAEEKSAAMVKEQYCSPVADWGAVI
ncbi:hypothetical protein ILYODFUR_005841, partial [Ilyodon furcidens]